MKTALITVFVLIAIVIALFFFLGKHSQKGQASGLSNGKLAKCSSKPNCVCSEYSDDVDHYIEAFTDAGSVESFDMAKVESVIQQMNGTVNSKEDNYIAATFTSSTFGFVDDFEIKADPSQGTIHFRSASRVGYSDGGVNQKRIELFKQLYKKK